MDNKHKINIDVPTLIIKLPVSSFVFISVTYRREIGEYGIITIESLIAEKGYVHKMKLLGKPRKTL